MYAIKNALLVKQSYPDVEITVYYMDIRTPSKGYEEFYDRARQMGVRFSQGRPSLITGEVTVENGQPVAVAISGKAVKVMEGRLTL